MSPPPRRIFAALLVLGICGLLAPGIAATAAQDGSDEQGAEWHSGTNVSMVAQLDSDGNAHWSLSTVINLTTEDEVEAYQAVAEEFEDGELPPLGLEAFETGLEGVNGQTDRAMRITDVERSTASPGELEAGQGRLTVSFTWVNFTLSENDRLHIDRNALVMENGELWLRGLSESQSLTIVAPEEYGVRDATVSAQGGELRWEGPQDFDETSLQATFIGPGDQPPGPGNGDDSDNSLSWLLVPVGVFVLVLAVLLTRSERMRIDLRERLDAVPLFGTADDSGTDPDRGEPDPATQRDETVEESTESADGTDDEIDEELLSDEERVERLLASNGGRMKQADIVKETDWSNAKVSQLLSAMEEEGRIDKLRIGRENLISFPDQDITETEQ